MSTPRSWEMFAGRDERNGGFRNFGPRPCVEAYGQCEIVPVEMVEDPEGRYFGWMDFGDGDWHKPDTEPCMIQGHEGIFAMQFPYGPKAEVDRGRGEIVRMSATEIVASGGVHQPDKEPNEK